MTKVVVLGGTGMLGSMVVEVLARDAAIELTATRRAADLPMLGRHPHAWSEFDCAAEAVDGCRKVLRGAEWAVNCIGITKPLIDDNDPVKVERAIRVNSLFPHVLAAAAEAEGIRILQIATDCVFSGIKGDYSERSAHDALDVYGKTKSLGEVASPVVHHLRASIIGPEVKDHKFLLDWFLAQPRSGAVNGFINHDWNGVTTVQFARICLGIIRHNTKLQRLHHLVPTGRATKAEMLEDFANYFDRRDIKVNRVQAPTVIDRTLATTTPDFNRKLWKVAGYSEPPTISAMIEELAHFSASVTRPAAA